MNTVSISLESKTDAENENAMNTIEDDLESSSQAPSQPMSLDSDSDTEPAECKDAESLDDEPVSLFGHLPHHVFLCRLVRSP